MPATHRHAAGIKCQQPVHSSQVMKNNTCCHRNKSQHTIILTYETKTMNKIMIWWLVWNRNCLFTVNQTIFITLRDVFTYNRSFHLIITTKVILKPVGRLYNRAYKIHHQLPGRTHHQCSDLPELCSGTKNQAALPSPEQLTINTDVCTASKIRFHEQGPQPD